MRIAALPLLGAMSLLAAPAVAVADTASFDKIWSHAVLMGDRKAGDYPFIKLRGRYQGQYYGVDADDDGSADGAETRRLRLGLDTRFNKAMRLSFDLNLNTDGKEPFVDDFDFLAFDWKFAQDTKLSIGKLRRKPLTREDSISSNEILTVERSLAANSVSLGNIGGVYVAHGMDSWDFGLGVLTGSLDDDLELPDGDGGMAYQLNVGRAINENSEWRLDYLFNEGDPENDAIKDYRHTISLNSASQWGRIGLLTDLILAESLDNGGDLLGVVLLPAYKLTPQIALVARYTFLSSGDDDGVRLQKRYERAADELTGDRGDEYHALYLGANYYVYGDKLKLMLGAEQSQLSRPGDSDFEALTGFAAFRVYF